MFFGQPNRSITSSAFGSAASLLAVVNAIRNGSLMARRNVRNGTRMISDTPPITMMAKTMQAAVHQQHELAEREEDPEAHLADRGRDGRHDADRREHHHVAGELEHRLRGALEHVDAPACPSRRWRPRRCRRRSRRRPAAGCRPRAIASTTDVGKSVHQHVPAGVRLGLLERLERVGASAAICTPAPGWKTLTRPRPRKSAMVVATSK